MWVAKFKLKDEKDIYSPLCEKYQVDIKGFPYTSYEKNKKIHLLVGFILEEDKEIQKKFISELKKNKKIKSLYQYKDFIFIHAVHSISRELQKEIKIFYNSRYLRTKPILVSKDGWEYWELACVERDELNKIVEVACREYSGELISIKKEKIKDVANLGFAPELPSKQFQAIKLAFEKGYYNYPHKITLSQLSKIIGKSYSSFQENLRKGEQKLISYFLKYR